MDQSMAWLRAHVGEWISIRAHAERAPLRFTLTLTLGELPEGWTRARGHARTWAGIVGLICITPFVLLLAATLLRMVLGFADCHPRRDGQPLHRHPGCDRDQPLAHHPRRFPASVRCRGGIGRARVRPSAPDRRPRRRGRRGPILRSPRRRLLRVPSRSPVRLLRPWPLTNSSHPGNARVGRQGLN